MISSCSEPLNFSQIKRVLVTKLRFHGDVLLSSPVFRSLKNHYPHLEIDALIYKETQDMLLLHPDVDQIHTIDKKWREQNLWRQFNNEKQLLSQLMSRQYDMIIHLTEHWRGFYLKHLLNIPHAVTAQYRRRENNWLWQRCFTHIYPIPPARNKASSHIDALRFLGVPVSEHEEQTSLTIGADDQKFVQQLISTHGLKNNGYILIHPTSRFFYKCCPPKAMALLINRLIEQNNRIVVTAAPNKKEAQYVDAMMEYVTTPIVNLSGQLTLKRLGAIIQQSQCFIGVDSAPMHMAVAVNTPVIALFGPTSAEVWGPKSKHSTVIQSPSTSKPLPIKGNRPNELENCALEMDMETVFQATLKMIKNT